MIGVDELISEAPESSVFLRPRWCAVVSMVFLLWTLLVALFPLMSESGLCYRDACLCTEDTVECRGVDRVPYHPTAVDPRSRLILKDCSLTELSGLGRFTRLDFLDIRGNPELPCHVVQANAGWVGTVLSDCLQPEPAPTPPRIKSSTPLPVVWTTLFSTTTDPTRSNQGSSSTPLPVVWTTLLKSTTTTTTITPSFTPASKDSLDYLPPAASQPIIYVSQEQTLIGISVGFSFSMAISITATIYLIWRKCTGRALFAQQAAQAVENPNYR